MNKVSHKVVSFFIKSVFFLTFTQVCVPYFNNIIYLFLFITSFLSVIYLINYGKIEKNFFQLLIWFFLPVLLASSIGLSFSLVYEERFDYAQLSAFGRVTNLVLIFIVIIFIPTYSYQRGYRYKDYESQAKCYWFGCLVLLLTAVWHLLSIHFNVFIFPFETRTNVHGSLNTYSFSARVTGIAEEPSYLAPFIIDFFIFTILICKNNLIKTLFLLLSLVVLIFTFSPSAYISLFISLVLSLLVIFKFNFTYKKIIIYLSAFFIFLTCIYITADYLVNLTYILDRLDSVNSSARFETIYKSLKFTFDSNFISLLFGHGVKSFSLLQQVISFDSGNQFFITSNNLFIDNIWETGIIGVLSYFIGFLSVIFMIKKSGVAKSQKFILWFMFFNWSFTSLYRADYANLHFFVLLYFLYVFSKNKKSE